MTTRIEQLFDAYSSDLERYAPALKGHFGCPICMRAFGRVPDLRKVVAEEHVVPRALGGRLVTLTCRPCNNSAGSELESHLVQRVRVDNGQIPAAVRMQVGDAVQRGGFRAQSDSNPAFEIKVVGKQSDPRQAEELKRLFRAGVEDVHLNLNYGYVLLRSVVALVRSAYLLMFRTFGYRFILDPSAQVLRDQISQPLTETEVLKGISWRMAAPVACDTALGIATWPDNELSFFALLALDKDSEHKSAVVVPPPGVDGSLFYKHLPALGQKRKCNLTILPMADGFVPLEELWAHFAAREAT